MTQGLGGLGNSFGEAFINFHANTDAVSKELTEGLKKADKEANKLTYKMGQGWGQKAADGMEDVLSKPQVADVFVKALDKGVTKTLKEKFATAGKVKVDVDVDKNQLGRLANSIVTSLKNSIGRAADALGPNGILDGILGGGSKGSGGFFKGFGGGITSLLGSLGSSIGNVGSASPFAPVIGGALIALIMALVGAVAALLNVFGPLLNAVFLLPAGIGAVVAAILPLTMAFDGLGSAAAALASGDLEAINEAMAKLGPNAQLVAKDLSRVIPWLEDIKRLVQETFLKPIANSDMINRLSVALGPPVIRGLEKVAEAAGLFVANLTTAAENPSIRKFLDTIFNLATSLYNNTSEGFNKFLVGIADLGTATGPYLENLTKLLGEGLGEFGGWLSRISADGTLNGFLDKLTIAVEALLELGGSAWDLLKSVVGAAGDEGRAMEFLDLLIFCIDSLTNFFESELGEESIKGMILLAEAFLVALTLIIVAFAEIAAIVEFIRFTVELWWYAMQGIMYLLGQYDDKAKGLGSSIINKSNELHNKPSYGTGAILPYRVDNATVAEQGPEAIIPLNDPARAMDLMNQSGLAGLAAANGGGQGMMFGPGSITINFNGALPTRDEAFRTGAAVADGINSGMAQRNTRMAVRTL